MVLVAGLACAPGLVAAQCIPPAVPYLPADRAEMQIYADLLRADFERYFSDVQTYFRCIDAERARVFAEAQDATAAYARFIASLRQD